MLSVIVFVLIFIFFSLLAIAYELHTLTERMIEIGTLVEGANRRSLRSSLGESEDDYAEESITKAHRTWKQTLSGILLAALVSSALVLVAYELFHSMK